MVRRSTAEALRLRAEREAARLEARRRELRERYPDIPAQAWSNLGAGLGGAGGKALGGWLRTVESLAKSLSHASKPPDIQVASDKLPPA